MLGFKRKNSDLVKTKEKSTELPSGLNINSIKSPKTNDKFTKGTFTNWDSESYSSWVNLVDNILTKKSQNYWTYDTEKNVLKESTPSFSFKIKDTTTFTFSKSNQTWDRKNGGNDFVNFKKEDEFALLNEPNSKYSKDIKDSHLSLKKENGGEVNIKIEGGFTKRENADNIIKYINNSHISIKREKSDEWSSADMNWILTIFFIFVLSLFFQKKIYMLKQRNNKWKFIFNNNFI